MRLKYRVAFNVLALLIVILSTYFLQPSISEQLANIPESSDQSIEKFQLLSTRSIDLLRQKGDEFVVISRMMSSSTVDSLYNMTLLQYNETQQLEVKWDVEVYLQFVGIEDINSISFSTILGWDRETIAIGINYYYFEIGENSTVNLRVNNYEVQMFSHKDGSLQSATLVDPSFVKKPIGNTECEPQSTSIKYYEGEILNSRLIFPYKMEYDCSGAEDLPVGSKSEDQIEIGIVDFDLASNETDILVLKTEEMDPLNGQFEISDWFIQLMDTDDGSDIVKIQFVEVQNEQLLRYYQFDLNTRAIKNDESQEFLIDNCNDDCDLQILSPRIIITITDKELSNPGGVLTLRDYTISLWDRNEIKYEWVVRMNSTAKLKHFFQTDDYLLFAGEEYYPGIIPKPLFIGTLSKSSEYYGLNYLPITKGGETVFSASTNLYKLFEMQDNEVLVFVDEIITQFEPSYSETAIIEYNTYYFRFSIKTNYRNSFTSMIVAYGLPISLSLAPLLLIMRRMVVSTSGASTETYPRFFE